VCLLARRSARVLAGVATAVVTMSCFVYLVGEGRGLACVCVGGGCSPWREQLSVLMTYRMETPTAASATAATPLGRPRAVRWLPARESHATHTQVHVTLPAVRMLWGMGTCQKPTTGVHPLPPLVSHAQRATSSMHARDPDPLHLTLSSLPQCASTAR
jgi:hypothetical protein